MEVQVLGIRKWRSQESFCKFLWITLIFAHLKIARISCMAELTNHHSPSKRCQENKWLLYNVKFCNSLLCFAIFVVKAMLNYILIRVSVIWRLVYKPGKCIRRPKIILHTWNGSELNGVAFFDAPLYVVSLNIIRSSNQFMLPTFWIHRKSLDFIINFCSLIHAYTTWSQMCRFWSILRSSIYMWIWLIEQVKNFILFGDIHKSIYFLHWKDVGAQLTLLAKDFGSLDCYATEFLIDGSTLSLLVLNNRKNLQVYFGISSVILRFS
jgi:hypothetical protein